MPTIDREPMPARLLDGSWRWHDGPSVVVGAPDLDAVDWSETVLFLDGPQWQDWVRLRREAEEAQSWELLPAGG